MGRAYGKCIAVRRNSWTRFSKGPSQPTCLSSRSCGSISSSTSRPRQPWGSRFRRPFWSWRPRSRGCGPQQRILSRCPPLIPGLGNTHSITDKPMVVLDTMDLEARAIVHRGVHEHHWGKEGKHHGCRGRGSQTLIAGDVPRMLTEVEAYLPLDHGIHQQSHDREHGQRRNPFRFLQPYGADGSRVLDPTKARFYRDMLFLIGLQDLRLRTHLGLHRRGQDGPSVRVLGGDQGLPVHDEAIADLDMGPLGLRRTAAPGPFLGDTDRFYTIVEGVITPGVRRGGPPAPPPPLLHGGGPLSRGAARAQ